MEVRLAHKFAASLVVSDGFLAPEVPDRIW